MKDWNNVIQPIWKQHFVANCVKDFIISRTMENFEF